MIALDDEDDWDAMEPNFDQPWPEFDLDDEEPQPEPGDFWIESNEDEEEV